jgi:hypothetical protein
MSCELINTIAKQTEILFYNVNTMLQTCDLDFILCDMPIWKHAYHALHSCDQWFINPQHFCEPDFHEPNLNSLDIISETSLSREELLSYFDDVRSKVMQYINALTDDMLYEMPPDCKYNRLSLILGQYRHFYAHLGNINATTIIQTNKWPRVIGLSGDLAAGLYE